ncbi:MAG TPA: amidohydrolase family protein [Dehalococcoidia bacterium]|nr:amidohydrolase family protein [Dehalococcoidia bacterium]
MAHSSFHLRATLLPYGDAASDLWIAGGRISFTPVVGARELAPAGGFALPGLVDSHVHLTVDFGRLGLPRGSAELVAENRRRQLAAGVLLLRDIGSVSDAAIGLPDDDGLPKVQPAGRYLAPADGYGGMQRPTTPERLPEVAAGQARLAPWVKIIADWPRVASDGAIPALHRGEVNYSAERLTAAVAAAHAAGARVAVHAMSHAAVAAAVAARVDCIEHATEADAAQVEAMAAAGIAWTPTLAALQATLRSAEHRGQPDVAAWLRACFERLRTVLPRARALGVPVLAGTDVLPPGAVVREVAALQESGLTPADALAAASSAARSYLGVAGIEAGAPADLVLYPVDPRNDPEVLASPKLIMLGGQIISRGA